VDRFDHSHLLSVLVRNQLFVRIVLLNLLRAAGVLNFDVFLSHRCSFYRICHYKAFLARARLKVPRRTHFSSRSVLIDGHCHVEITGW